jgi:hypothetical protein
MQPLAAVLETFKASVNWPGEYTQIDHVGRPLLIYYEKQLRLMLIPFFSTDILAGLRDRPFWEHMRDQMLDLPPVNELGLVIHGDCTDDDQFVEIFCECLSRKVNPFFTHPANKVREKHLVSRILENAGISETEIFEQYFEQPRQD